MRHVNSTRWIFIGLILIGIGFVAVANKLFNEYILSIITFVGISIILAVSLNITNGFTGLFSLGHPAFMAIGGYVAAILTFPVNRKAMLLPDMYPWLAKLQISFLPAMLIGGILAAMTALFVGVPVLRLRGHYLAVATMGFLIIVQVLIRNWDTMTRGPLGLNGLLRNSAIFRFSLCSSSTAKLRAVSIITGTPDISEPWRSLVTSSTPLIPGICKSVTITSGLCSQASL